MPRATKKQEEEAASALGPQGQAALGIRRTLRSFLGDNILTRGLIDYAPRKGGNRR